MTLKFLTPIAGVQAGGRLYCSSACAPATPAAEGEAKAAASSRRLPPTGAAAKAESASPVVLATGECPRSSWHERGAALAQPAAPWALPKKGSAPIPSSTRGQQYTLLYPARGRARRKPPCMCTGGLRHVVRFLEGGGGADARRLAPLLQ